MLSTTIAFTRHVANFYDDLDHTMVVSVTAAVVLILQFPWIVFYIWWVYSSMNAPIARVAYTDTPLVKIMASRPSCKWISNAEVRERFDSCTELMEWFLCVPFRMNFQGVWSNASEDESYLQRYGSMIQTFSPASGCCDAHCLAVVITLGGRGRCWDRIPVWRLPSVAEDVHHLGARQHCEKWERSCLLAI